MSYVVLYDCTVTCYRGQARKREIYPKSFLISHLLSPLFSYKVLCQLADSRFVVAYSWDARICIILCVCVDGEIFPVGKY